MIEWSERSNNFTAEIRAGELVIFTVAVETTGNWGDWWYAGIYLGREQYTNEEVWPAKIRGLEAAKRAAEAKVRELIGQMAASAGVSGA